jgi:hypothetical protein
MGVTRYLPNPDADPGYVPDVGETFETTLVWEWRLWRWLPFPGYYTRTHQETRSYRVNSWMRRRQPRPEPQDEQSRLVREIMDKLIAEDPMYGPRCAGPDNVPLEWCRREDAEYVSGVGVAGVIARLSDITLTGRVSWDEETIDGYRDFANRLAGEPLT